MVNCFPFYQNFRWEEIFIFSQLKMKAQIFELPRKIILSPILQGMGKSDGNKFCRISFLTKKANSPTPYVVNFLDFLWFFMQLSI